uniref:Thrombospondin type 1 domain containing protein n=1 Tax=Babesia bovis TaxID=5865 RepID=A7AUJ3_BABBO|eukprot:XP_001610172.1 hypothetical protein [Babesia bovis T2Bo]
MHDLQYAEEYFDPKYEINEVEVTNGTWTEVKFTNPIDSPIIYTSTPQTDHDLLHVEVSDVSSTGFWITSYMLSCTIYCVKIHSDVKHTIQWIGLSKGDHSPDPNNSIRAGVVSCNTDGHVRLPIDPLRNWIVILQNQGDTNHTNDRDNGQTASIHIPILVKGKRNYRVHFVVNELGKSSPQTIKLGYLAIENRREIRLHRLRIMTFDEKPDFRGVAKVSLSLPYTWPYPKNVFSYVKVCLEGEEQDEKNLPSASLRLNVFGEAPAVSSEALNYDFSTDITIVAILATHRLHMTRVFGFVIQDMGSAMAEEICTYSQKKGYRHLSRSCYDSCLSADGIQSCIYDDDLIECFHKKRPQCVIEAPGMNSLINQYITFMKKRDIDSGMNNPGNKEPENPADDGDESKTNNSPAKVDDRHTDSYYDGEIVMDRDCIPGPWGEWSACSNKCSSGRLATVQTRRRPVYANKVGLTSSSCSTVETRECTNVPPCSEFCYSREGSGDPNVFQQKYFYIWSDKCVDIYADHDVEKENFQFIPGSKHESAIVTRMGTTQNRPGLPEAQAQFGTTNSDRYDKRCEDPNNWSACNAPCAKKIDDTITEYLRVPIVCYDHRRPCRRKLHVCPTEEELKSKPDYNTCVLNYSFYDVSIGSWSKDGACMCEDGVACSAEEVHVLGDSTELVSTDNEGYLEHLVRATPYQLHISLANYHRIELPTDVVRDVAYDQFKQGDIDNYCATGNVELNNFAEDILWVDCRLAVSYDYRHDFHCQDRCKIMRRTCEIDIPAVHIAEIGRCVSDRIRHFPTNIFVLNHKFNGCSDPLTTSALTEAEMCDIVEKNIKLTRQCTMLCRRLVNMCKTLLEHSREAKIRRCILDHVKYNDVNMKADQKVEFGLHCVFKRTKLMGAGLVYCKKRKLICDTEPWSQWSLCSQTCIYVRDGRVFMPSRTRTRRLKVTNGVNIDECISKGVVLKETVDCLWLPQCPDDPAIRKEISTHRSHLAREQVIESTWDLQGWVLNDSRQGESSVDHHCTLYSGQRDVTKNNIIYQLLCRENEMRSVLFNQPTGFYRYSCLTRSFLRQDFDAHNELCNEGGNTSFVSCYGVPKSRSLYIFTVLSAVLGGLTSTIIFVYTYKRSSFV